MPVSSLYTLHTRTQRERGRERKGKREGIERERGGGGGVLLSFSKTFLLWWLQF